MDCVILNVSFKYLNFYASFMGRVRTKFIKRISNKLVLKHKDEFKKDFKDNKKIVETLVEVKSKKLRNVIAGYVTRLMKKDDITLSKKQH